MWEDSESDSVRTSFKAPTRGLWESGAKAKPAARAVRPPQPHAPKHQTQVIKELEPVRPQSAVRTANPWEQQQSTARAAPQVPANPWEQQQSKSSKKAKPKQRQRDGLQFAKDVESWFQPSKKDKKKKHRKSSSSSSSSSSFSLSCSSDSEHRKPRGPFAFVDAAAFGIKSETTANVQGYNAANNEPPKYVEFQFPVRSPRTLLWRLDVAEFVPTLTNQTCDCCEGGLLIELERGRVGCGDFVSIVNGEEIQLGTPFVLPFNGRGRVSFNSPGGCNAKIRLTITSILP